MYTIPDACAVLGVSRVTLWRLTRRKKIETVRLEIDARFRYINENDLLALAEEINQAHHLQITKLRAEIAELRARVQDLEEHVQTSDSEGANIQA